MAYVTTCLSLLSPSIPLSPGERDAYAEELVRLSNVIPACVRDMTPTFICKLSVSSGEQKVYVGQKLAVGVSITSNLPKDVKMGKLCLRLVCGDALFILEQAGVVLKPGMPPSPHTRAHTSFFV